MDATIFIFFRKKKKRRRINNNNPITAFIYVSENNLHLRTEWFKLYSIFLELQCKKYWNNYTESLFAAPHSTCIIINKASQFYLNITAWFWD